MMGRRSKGSINPIVRRKKFALQNEKELAVDGDIINFVLLFILISSNLTTATQKKRKEKSVLNKVIRC
jgi:hypothetical protein